MFASQPIAGDTIAGNRGDPIVATFAMDATSSASVRGERLYTLLGNVVAGSQITASPMSITYLRAVMDARSTTTAEMVVAPALGPIVVVSGVDGIFERVRDARATVRGQSTLSASFQRLWNPEDGGGGDIWVPVDDYKGGGHG